MNLYRIEEQEAIEEGSEQEVEIRPATVVAVEKIQEHLRNNYDVDTSIAVLDYALCQMRKDADTNVHLTETTAY